MTLGLKVQGGESDIAVFKERFVGVLGFFLLDDSENEQYSIFMNMEKKHLQGSECIRRTPQAVSSGCFCRGGSDQDD